MKHLITVLVTLLISPWVFATVQSSDILISGKDTIYLKTFPLEILELQHRPFGYTRTTAPSTACWRGCIAVWRIEDSKLFLEKLIRCHGDGQNGEENIIELFQKNGLEFKTKNKMILASWYSQDLYKMNFSIAQFYKNKIFLYEGGYNKKKEKNVMLRIEKGLVMKEHLKS